MALRESLSGAADGVRARCWGSTVPDFWYGFQIRHDLPDWFLTCETAKSPLGLCKVDVLVRFV